MAHEQRSPAVLVLVLFALLSTCTAGDVAVTGPREKLCQACTQAVEQLEVVLADPDLVNQSIDILEGAVCAKIPGDQQAQCKAAVEQYVPIVFAELQSEVTVDNICVDTTKLCPPGAAATAGFQGPEDCYACRLVVKLLKKHLENPKTQAKIKGFLDDRCSRIANSTMEAECVDAVDKFLPVLFANLDVILNDKKLCKDASLCLKRLRTAAVAAA